MTPIDPMAFIGDPPLWRPAADEVHISVTFTWDIAEGKRLAAAWNGHYPVVRLGGPAFNVRPNGFTPGLYLRSGVTFTRRGCNHNCPWCLVPRREGKLKEIVEFAPGHIIQDNNLLQASRPHLRRVFAMLKSQRKAAVLSGGLDARFMDDWIIDKLQELRIKQLFLAADTASAMRSLGRALEKLAFLSRDKKRVYTLIAFNDETKAKAEKRLETIWELGGMPFAQLYQPPDKYIEYSREWKRLARNWSRPAIMKKMHRPQGAVSSAQYHLGFKEKK